MMMAKKLLSATDVADINPVDLTFDEDVITASFKLKKIYETLSKIFGAIDKWDKVLVTMAMAKRAMKPELGGRTFNITFGNQVIPIYKPRENQGIDDSVVTYKRLNACFARFIIESKMTGIVNPMANSFGLERYAISEDPKKRKIYYLTCAGSEFLFDYYPFEVSVVALFRTAQLKKMIAENEKGKFGRNLESLRHEMRIIWENLSRRLTKNSNGQERNIDHILNLIMGDKEDYQEYKAIAADMMAISPSTKKRTADGTKLCTKACEFIKLLSSSGTKFEPEDEDEGGVSTFGVVN